MTVMPIQPQGLLSDNDRKDLFSRAYVQAIASAAGYASEPTGSVDRDSIDLRISSSGTYCTFDSPCIEVQLKCTASECVEEEHIQFDLPVKNYNDLRKKSLSPRFLIVVLVPDDFDEWLKQSEQEAIVKKCAYYFSLKGMGRTNNTTTIRIRIPRSNILDSTALHTIFAKAGAGDYL